MKVYFYTPEHLMPDTLPAQTDFTWKGYSLGRFCWGLLTCNRLQLAGVDCEFTTTLPEEGIIIAHRACFPDSLVPTRKQILVCIQADWSRHPFAALHICQNQAQTHIAGVPRLERFATGKTYFVHHWPQPGMTGRDKARGNKLENIMYFGLEENLAPELKSEDWLTFCAKHNINWQVVGNPEAWKDYSQADAVLFARDFSGKKHINKPPSKLMNAWLTGAIPICTRESAYVDEIDSEDDAILVSGYDDLKAQLAALLSDPARITRLQQRGAEKAPHYTPDAIVQEWKAIVETLRTFSMTRTQYASFMIKRRFSYWLCRSLRWMDPR